MGIEVPRDRIAPLPA
ncbi:hypothetical protein STIAU_0842, partial [Stigmatella aurantiaca DW4/3-1]